MDETFAPANLLSREQVQALSRRSDGPGLAMLASKIAGLVVTGYLIYLARGTWWLAPAMVVHGVQVAFLFAGLHECCHWTPFRSRALNEVVGYLCGLATFYPLGYLRFFHFAHHRYTQDPARDPELAGIDLSTRGKFLCWATGIPYWRRRIWGSLRHALSGRVTQPFIEAKFHRSVVLEARAIWTVYLATAVIAALTDPWAPILYWLGPIFLAQPTLRLYLNGEHAGRPHVAESLANARTTITHPWIRWLAWNMPYHTEHHLYPNVPFHALPALHELVKPRLIEQGAGYTGVNRALWLALTR
ncbi:MAG: fatty acid desaturase [Rhodospirillales bacterium]|nr:fatty acid desaturase [Rhodospirillales bacterium]